MDREKLIEKVYELYNLDSDRGVHYDFAFEGDLNRAIGRLVETEEWAINFLEGYLKEFDE